MDIPDFDFEPRGDEYVRLVKASSEHNLRFPEKIAETLERLHQDRDGDERYLFASSLRPLFDFAKPFTGAPLHIVCTTGLPGVLLNILLDPRIYMWHQSSSSFYHPELEVSKPHTPNLGFSTF